MEGDIPDQQIQVHPQDTILANETFTQQLDETAQVQISSSMIALVESDVTNADATEVATETLSFTVENDSFKTPNKCGQKNNDKSVLNGVDVRNYLQYTAAMIMGVPLKDLEDHSLSLFEAGMNESESLIFMKKIDNILPAGVEITTSFISEHPNIDSIVKFIMDIVDGNRHPENDKGIRIEQLQHSLEDIVDKYTLYIRDSYTQSAIVASQKSTRKVFLLTATGFLGTHILYMLLTLTSCKIYCLVRKKKIRTPKASLKRAFLRNNLDTSLVDSDRLIALGANLSEPYLGLPENQYEIMLNDITTIIHGAFCAKPGMPLTVYESSAILGTANLLLFSAQKEFHFISSIDACVNSSWENVPEGILPLRASITTCDGFGLSKLAIETIITNTFDYLQLGQVSIIRIDQITSHTETGVWDPNEWVPMLLGIAGLSGRMPTFDANLDWIPVDIAAKAIVDLVSSDATFRIQVFHISNPNPTITWEQYLDRLEESGMKFSRQELPKWLGQLWIDVEENSFDENICSLLTGHFNRMAFNPDNGKKTRALLDLTNTKTLTGALSTCPSLNNESLIKSNIDWLKNTGHLSEIGLDQQKSLSKSRLKLKRPSENGDPGFWDWIYVTVPLMVLFFIIDLLWNIFSRSFMEVTVVAGWIVTVMFVNDNADDQTRLRDSSLDSRVDIKRHENNGRKKKKVNRRRIKRNAE
ncbi:10294_t:CDS:1 [Cetraspora pellucida]|uniref:10294_t:CDS:1 n=1 Tax=Cetraspora pellucida TaxID=1433469 RepID=A0A9N9N740_9GLOM|nr:10294_t:CDS:1 [Cetraspora pellucida]